LQACREVSEKYPSLKYEEMIIDNCTMQLVKTPQQFDVMVMPNLYGTIVNNTCAGITGGLGMTPGFDIGDHFQVGPSLLFNPSASDRATGTWLWT